MPLAHLFLALVPLAWLVPNHDYPWVSAWNEGTAIALLLVGVLLLPARPPAAAPIRLPLPWALLITLAMLWAGLQAGAGVVIFHGDLVMWLAYLLVLALSLVAGSTLPAPADDDRIDGLDALALGLAASAIASVAIALMQWTGVQALPLPAIDIRPGARPFANVAQANHYGSLLFLGLCALALLKSRQKMGPTGFGVGAAFLAWGMVMSGSRTGWLQMGLFGAAVLLARRRRVDPGIGYGGLLSLLGGFAALTAAWPSINQRLLLAGGRNTVLHFEGGGRLEIWRALLDAVAREPWLGHGWLQGGRAQLAVATDHPAIGRLFDRAHNLVLETLVAAGVPVGAAILAGLGAAWLWQLRAVRSPRALWALVAASGLLVHAMLEYPLEFAYFLVPFGLLLGAAHAVDPGVRSVPVPAVAARGVAAGLLGLFAVVAADYLQAEQNFRTFRLESARIGTTRIESAPPELRLLDQLQAFLTYARLEAAPGLPPERLQWMRQVASRYPIPPVLFRLAIAEGLNGRPEAAARMLRTLCHVHPRPRCEEARELWPDLQRRHPELRPVGLPDLPPPPA